MPYRNKQTNAMEQSPCWHDDSCSADGEHSRFLWNLSVYCCVHSIQPLDPILNRINQPTTSHPLSLTLLHSRVVSEMIASFKISLSHMLHCPFMSFSVNFSGMRNVNRTEFPGTVIITAGLISGLKCILMLSSQKVVRIGQPNRILFLLCAKLLGSPSY
jgi:hypothetical protein